MARGKRKHADHRADTRGGGWGGLPHCVTDSLAYRHLSLWGRAVLVELVREMNGYNNGEIGLSQREIAERLRTSNFRRIGRAIAELMEHGLIDVAVEGQWKERQARQYRLTFVNTGNPGSYRPATNEYRDWHPPKEKSGVEPVSAEMAKSAEPVSARPHIAAEPVSAGFNGKLPKSPSASAEPVSSLIYSHTQADNFQGNIPLNSGGGGFCERCSSPFPTTKATRRFCSEACRKAAEKQRYLERRHTMAASHG